MLPTKFRVSRPFGSAEEVQNIFQDSSRGGHLKFPISTILAVFHLRRPYTFCSFESIGLGM